MPAWQLIWREVGVPSGGIRDQGADPVCSSCCLVIQGQSGDQKACHSAGCMIGHRRANSRRLMPSAGAGAAAGEVQRRAETRAWGAQCSGASAHQHMNRGSGQEQSREGRRVDSGWKWLSGARL